MLRIECRKSKKGNPYLCITYEGHILTVDEQTIVYFATQYGYTKRDVYNLEIGDELIIK